MELIFCVAMVTLCFFCAAMITFRNVEFLFARLQFLWFEGVAAVRVELHDVRSENTT